MKSIHLTQACDDSWVLDRLLDVLEDVESENLKNLLRIESQGKTIQKLRGEKILLAREVEHLAHQLSQSVRIQKEAFP